jgi:thioredoxin 1
MAENKPIELNSDNFDKTVKGEKPVFVDFWAPWCGPCQIMLPIVDDLAANSKNKDKVIFAKVNIDENPEIAAKYNIMSVPSLLIFNGPKVINSMIGVTPQDQIETVLDKIV